MTRRTTDKARESLKAEFDARIRAMNTPKARRAVNALFTATSAELGQAAVRAARKQAKAEK
jgi:hypothetical protein